MDRLWDFLVESCKAFFIPVICAYYSICGNLFLNTAASDASGFERIGDTLLIPFQYLFCGKLATQMEDGSWVYTQRFDYHDYFWVKTAASIAALPPTFVLGCAAKGLAYATTQNRLSLIEADFLSPKIQSHLDTYRKFGLQIADPNQAEWFEPQNYARRPGDEKHLEIEKKALEAVGSLLTEAQIPWWVDCGTCLGAYRYGGFIPWDTDIDIAVLEPDFENIRKALLKLDSSKYLVQDWSGRLNPQSYFKVYIRDTGILIDIYHFAIDPEAKTLSYIFSLDTSSLFPQWWKERERRFTAPTSFDVVFPLKRTRIDGVEVFIPNDPAAYLQRYYGKNLNPAKIYDPETNRYEKDSSHPYWQIPNVY